MKAPPDQPAMTATSIPVYLFVPTLGAGGAEHVTVQLANYWTSEGVPVELLTACANGPVRSLVGPTVRVRELGGGRMRHAFFPLLGVMVRRSPRRLLVTLNHAIVMAVLARDILRANCRIVGRVSTHVTSSVAEDPWPLRRRLKTVVLRTALNRCDALIVGSRGVKEDLTTSWGVPADKVVQISNPLDINDIVLQGNETCDHDWLKGEREFSVGVAVGRLVAAKGYDILLKALERIRRHVDFRLIICGTGPERNTLSQLSRELGIADAVDFVGFVHRPYRLVSTADIFILSSRREGMPNALLGALASAPRIVATDCESGPKEILDDGALGVLVPPENPKELADAVMRELESPPTPVPRRACERYSLDKVARAYLRTLEGG